MGFEARVLAVLIASPGDTRDSRNLVEAAILSWNRDRARAEKVVLLPLRWEFDAVPELGGDAQDILNAQLVDEADIVIGLFHSRLGSHTPRGVSGTVEEIERSHENGAKVHVFFSEMPHPADVDPEQLKMLREFRAELQERGLLGSFASPDDLAAKVRTALERDVAELVSVVDEGANATSTPARGAVLRARFVFEREPHTDSRGKVRMRNRRERLVVENIGEAAAESLVVSIDPSGDGAAPHLVTEPTAERLPPEASVGFPLAVYKGVASQWRVTMRWEEDGNAREETQSVTPF